MATAETRQFFRPHQFSPGPQIYHWYNNCESYWLLGKAMAQAMIKLLGPLPPLPPPLPPPQPAPAPPPADDDGVVLFQQGGNGTLRLKLVDFSPNKGLSGSPLAWDACAGPSGVRRFDNGEPVWSHGTALGEVQVTGSLVVRISTLCCFHYSYPSCAQDRSQNFNATDGPVNFMGNYVEIVSSKPKRSPTRPLKSDDDSQIPVAPGLTLFKMGMGGYSCFRVPGVVQLGHRPQATAVRPERPHAGCWTTV